MTSTNTLTSIPTIVQRMAYFSYAVSWTGTPTGTFSVEVSNDYTQNSAGGAGNAGTWTALTLTGSPVASGSAGNGFIDIDGCASYAVRLKYVNSSGSGTLQAWINGKTI